jgi:small subunit ribosomal protein S15
VLRIKYKHLSEIAGIILVLTGPVRGESCRYGDLLKFFSGEAYVMPLNKELKTKTITDFATHDGDTGSPEVQVALITARITQLTGHLRINRHDEASRMGLLKLVGQRRRLLAYLRKKDFAKYQAISERLSLRQK